jgi:NCAIR mutase (PurE)-related protein
MGEAMDYNLPVQKGLKEILTWVREGKLGVEEALERLASFPYEDLGFAKPDTHRALRRGFPEVILGEGKTAEQVVGIVRKLWEASPRLLITRANEEIFQGVKKEFPEAFYHSWARAVVLDRLRESPTRPGVMLVSAGTSDVPVAEEAAITAELMGNIVERAYDVGVAGLHRLLDQLPKLRHARVVVAVAGMEGALPSVIAGLVAVPVVAVPTSTGYGASFQGLAALLAMLNSCAPGVAVVNIDNGFGAGYLAGLINLGKCASCP